MPHFAAEVSGIDLSSDRTPDATIAALRGTIDAFAVVVLRDQPLDDEAQIRFSERLGPLETIYRLKLETAAMDRHVNVLSNVDPETGRIYEPSDPRLRYWDGNELWHSDSSFKPVPAKYSILSARVVPAEGGETLYADMRLVWDELPDEHKAALRDLVAEHSLVYSRGISNPDRAFFSEEEKETLKPVRHALVREHPVTRRLAVYAGSHASHIEGLALDEGRAIIRALLERATVPERVYRHRWRANDVVIWDNRSVVHRATKFDAARHPRVMHRTTVAGDGPTV
ncbi:MAG: TauD/TfdA family dioxygenase [Candidatus Eremiobacteraeota bacterium]|nr:TauD/TfdA family dioxygenase [Candidatus Eremiobacteraeota bacterium]